MKKLLLLTLVLLGGAMQVNAQRTGDDLKIYIGAYNVSGGDYWNNVKVSYWGEGLTSGEVEGTTITYNGKTWYEFDFSRDVYAGKIKFVCYDGTWGGSHQTNDINTEVSKDTFYEINWAGYGEKCTLTEIYDAKYLYRISDAKSFLMDQDGSSFSLTIDNKTSTSDDYTFVIADTRAYKNDCTIDWNNENRADAKWFYWRPGQLSDNKEFAFEKVEDFDCWRNSGENNAFSVSSKPYFFNIEMDLSDWDAGKITVAPYNTTTISSVGYSTYSNGEMCTISGATAYTVSANNTSSVTMNEMAAATIWPASAGMILKGTPDAPVTISAVASDATATTIGTNYLKGTGNSSAVITATAYTYVFANDPTHGVGFYLAEGNGTLAAHKAYLDLSEAPGKAGEFLSFNFDEEETDGISKVANANFDANAQVYNLAGQKVGANYKGIVIVNGKKVVRK